MAAANPNPLRITDEIWWLWTSCNDAISGVRYGGSYVKKPGYHATVDDNQANWPGNYSIKLQLDLKGVQTKTRGLDLTMSDAEMKKRTGYLRRAALHPEDDRLDALREFYGTLDGKTVYGLTHTGPGRPWESSSSDTSHLWHIHLSFFASFVDEMQMIEPVYSVIVGETWEDWKERKATVGDLLMLKKGDTGAAGSLMGERVRALQSMIWDAGFYLVDDIAKAVTGTYDTQTAEALRRVRKAAGSTVWENPKSGDKVTGAVYAQLMKMHATAFAGEDGADGEDGVDGEDGKDGVVLPGTILKITGTVTADGTVT